MVASASSPTTAGLHLALLPSALRLAGDVGEAALGLRERLGGAGDEGLDLSGDDCEALAGLSGAGGLDGSVEREEVCRRGDGRDLLEDGTDSRGGHPAGASDVVLGRDLGDGV